METELIFMIVRELIVSFRSIASYFIIVRPTHSAQKKKTIFKPNPVLLSVGDIKPFDWVFI